LTSRVLVLGLSTGHKVGLAVTAFVFILFALGSAFLFPRVRPQYPGRGLPAFIIVAFVFFSPTFLLPPRPPNWAGTRRPH
jgi:hypothetical protein